MEYTIRGKLIKGFPDYVIYPDGKIYSCIRHQIMRPTPSNGYNQIGMTNNKGQRKNKFIHCLVAEHFIDNSENKPCVDHIDRNRLNNNVSNLRWVTRSENQQNRGIQINNTSGMKNIRFHKKNNKWCYQKMVKSIPYTFYNKNKQVVLWCKLVHSLLS